MFVCVCVVQTDVRSSRAQEVSASISSDAGLQKSSEGSCSQRGHQAGLHGRESQHSCRGKDPSRKEWAEFHFFPFLLCCPCFSISLLFVLSTESKNSSVAPSHPARSKDFNPSSDAATTAYPPFSSLMLIHIKGQKTLRLLCMCVTMMIFRRLY